jgi:hypothetical protein
LVSDLVPKTQGQRLSQFLTFPKMPELQDPAQTAAPAPKQEEEFQQVSIQKTKSGVERFRIPVDESEPEIPISLKMPNEPISVENIFNAVDDVEEFQVRESRTQPKVASSTKTGIVPPPPLPKTAAPTTTPAASVLPQWNEADIEKLVRAQAKEMIEAVVWKVLPELAQQIIEREIAKLLKEKDASLYR